MPELQLGKLPDQTPVKITLAAAPELNQALQDYAAVYRATYGQAEAIAELVAFMIEAFLHSDRGFAKARKRYSLGLLSPNRDGPVEWLRRPYCTHCCDLLSGWFDRLGLVSP